jgi:phosphoribosylformylglycinamidine cyclo-ligase
MRPQRDLSYRITALPPVSEVLTFLVEQATMDLVAAYSTFNMGCGFAVYCERGAGEAVVQQAAQLGLDAQVAGVVEAGPRRVILSEIDVVFESGDLDLAPRARS